MEEIAAELYGLPLAEFRARRDEWARRQHEAGPSLMKGETPKGVRAARATAR